MHASWGESKDQLGVKKVNKDPASQVVLVLKNLPADAGDGGLGLIPVLGRSPGVGNGRPFQYSCLENSMVRELRFSGAPRHHAPPHLVHGTPAASVIP